MPRNKPIAEAASLKNRRTVRFWQLAEEILRDVAPFKRKTTQELYFIYLGELKIELGDIDIDTFSRKDYMEWMRGFKLRKDRKTFFDYTKFINLAFRYAYNERYINHLTKFPSVDVDHKPFYRNYTQKEIHRLSGAMSPVLQAQFILSYECFMRLREVLYLTWDRVDLDTKTIILRAQDVKTGSKGARVGRNIPLSPNACEALARLERESISHYVFPSPGNPDAPVEENKWAWKAAKDRAGVLGKARWHDIRHTALTFAVMVLHIPLAHLSKVAGVSIKTLERVYLHHNIEDVRMVTEKMNALKKVV